MLVKILDKHGLAVLEGVQKEIFLKYRAAKEVHGPILKELERTHANCDLYTGLDQKVVPKLLPTTSLKKELLSSASSATFRRQSTHGSAAMMYELLIVHISLFLTFFLIICTFVCDVCCRSVLRKGPSQLQDDNDSQQVIDGSRPFVPSTLLIDYNKLCDDIYICDWI